MKPPTVKVLKDGVEEEREAELHVCQRSYRPLVNHSSPLQPKVYAGERLVETVDGRFYIYDDQGAY